MKVPFFDLTQNRFGMTGFLALSLGLGACGKKDTGGAAYQPLSDSDKEKVLGVVKSTIRSAGAVAQRASYQNRNFNSALAELSAMAKSAGVYAAESDDYGTMSAELENCIPETKGLDSLEEGGLNGPLSMGNIDGSMSITGEKCPISLGLTVKLTSSSDKKSMNAQVTANYVVKNEDYKKLNDVDAFNFALQMSFKQSGQNSGSVNFNMDSKVHSQKMGDISVVGSLNLTVSEKSGGQNSPSITSKITLTGGGVTGVFEIKATEDPTKKMPTVLLNGKALTEEEIMSLVKEADPDNTPNSTPSSGYSPGSPVSSPSTPSSPSGVTVLEGTYDAYEGPEHIAYLGIRFSGNRLKLTTDCEKFAYSLYGQQIVVPAHAKGKVVAAESTIQVIGNKFLINETDQSEIFDFAVKNGNSHENVSCSVEIQKETMSFKALPSNSGFEIYSENNFNERLTLKRR